MHCHADSCYMPTGIHLHSYCSAVGTDSTGTCLGLLRPFASCSLVPQECPAVHDPSYVLAQ